MVGLVISIIPSREAISISTRQTTNGYAPQLAPTSRDLVAVLGVTVSWVASSTSTDEWPEPIQNRSLLAEREYWHGAGLAEKIQHRRLALALTEGEADREAALSTAPVNLLQGLGIALRGHRQGDGRDGSSRAIDR
jgi:hypothetical protein